jgi:hypothetical protein
VAVGAPADWLVVVGKLLLDTVGVERRGQVIRGLFVRSTGFLREESRERAESSRQAV